MRLLNTSQFRWIYILAYLLSLDKKVEDSYNLRQYVLARMEMWKKVFTKL